MMKHFLITRFNIVQDWYKTANRNNTPIQTNDWLIERFRLFETYCLPSVVHQSNLNFTWFVLFNSETPEFFKQKIAGYATKYSIFTPLFLEPYGNEAVLLEKTITSLAGNVQHVITTRLDSDDMIREDYIQMIQEMYDPKQKDVFLNYGSGFQYDLYNGVIYAYNNFSMSHYVSRVSAYPPPHTHHHHPHTHTTVNGECHIQTVMVDHSRLHDFADYQEMRILGGGAWIEIVHSCNAWNRVGLGKPMLYVDELKRFPKLHLSTKAFIIARIKWRIKKMYAWLRRKVEKYIDRSTINH